MNFINDHDGEEMGGGGFKHTVDISALTSFSNCHLSLVFFFLSVTPPLRQIQGLGLEFELLQLQQTTTQW